MTKMSADYIDWICELKKRNIREFQYRDLPEDLKIKGMIIKGSTEGDLKRIEKNKKGITLWRLV